MPPRSLVTCAGISLDDPHALPETSFLWNWFWDQQCFILPKEARRQVTLQPSDGSQVSFLFTPTPTPYHVSEVLCVVRLSLTLKVCSYALVFACATALSAAVLVLFVSHLGVLLGVRSWA